MVITKQAIDWVTRANVDCGAFENVMGFGFCQQDQEHSPLAALINSMASKGYTAEAVEVCSSTFVALIRRR